MTDSKHLHEEGVKIRYRIKGKLGDAGKAIMRAVSLTKTGDFRRAAEASELANRQYKEILELERLAMEFEQRASELESRAYQIEKQEAELQAKVQTQLETLERQRKSLQGYY